MSLFLTLMWLHMCVCWKSSQSCPLMMHTLFCLYYAALLKLLKWKPNQAKPNPHPEASLHTHTHTHTHTHSQEVERNGSSFWVGRETSNWTFRYTTVSFWWWWSQGEDDSIPVAPSLRKGAWNQAPQKQEEKFKSASQKGPDLLMVTLEIQVFIWLSLTIRLDESAWTRCGHTGRCTSRTECAFIKTSESDCIC